MVVEHNTPYLSAKEVQIRALKRKLNGELVKEIEQEPDLVSVAKIDHVVRILDRLEFRQQTNKKSFKEKFFKKYFNDLEYVYEKHRVLKKKRLRSRLFIGVLIALLIVVVYYRNYCFEN